MTNTYTLLGATPIVPEADLTNLTSAANKRGDTRVGGDSAGKYPNKKVLVQLTSDSTLKEVFALGGKSSDSWRVVDGSANIDPVNIIPAAGGWTIGADSTYVAGLITTDAGNDAAGRASQSVNLKAGTYFVSGASAGEGTLVSCDRPRLRVGTAAANSTYGSFTGALSTEFLHATAAESLTVKEEFGFQIVLTADDEVFFTLDNVDEAGVLQAGSSYLLLNLVEAV